MDHQTLAARHAEKLLSLFQEFVVPRTTHPFRAKTYDELRSRKFISNVGRMARIKWIAWF
jgi:hypothetical protein